MRIALIGATGLIGSHLLPLLGGHDLLVLTRRPTGAAGVREKVGEMSDWPALLDGEAVDVAVSTLGTTWRKAGSWETFAKVDHEAVLAFARAARGCGARQMICVSSVGADPESANAYLALKGRVEHDLDAVGFERLDLFRPGLLRGERGPDRRLGERIGILVSPLVNLLLRGAMDRFAAIDANRVAAAIAACIGAAERGRFIHYNREIRGAARRDARARLR